MLAELRRIVEKVSQASSFDAAMQLLVGEIRLTMQVDCCSVYQADSEKQQLLLRATDGLAQAAVGHARIHFDEGVVGLVARRQEPINLADVHHHPSFKYLPEAEEDSFRSFLGTPIIYRRQLIGVLVVQQSQIRSFSDAEEAFLVTLSAHLSAVLSQAEAFEATRPSPSPALPKDALKGIAGSPGIAMASGWYCEPPAELGELELETTTQIDDELGLLEHAIGCTELDIQRISGRLGDDLPQDVLSIFQVYQGMLSDPGFEKALRLKVKQGYTAISALQLVRDEYLEQFAALNDNYLRERAVDLRDLCSRILRHLSEPQSLKIPERDFVLIATEITATMLGDLPRDKLKGIVSSQGATNSHAAILARALGIPAVLGVSLDLKLLSGRDLIVDGHNGRLFVEPDFILRLEYRQLLRQERMLADQINKDLEEPACSLDGQQIELLINAGLSADADMAQHVADGVGLYRTEVPFLMQNRFPSETEQFQSYLKMLESYRDKPVCMRTLDIGGDKQLPYFPIHEENPFLGWRGIRMTLDQPDIFLVQCRAMYRAALEHTNLSIMLPMISSLAEVEHARELMTRAWNEVVEELPGDHNYRCPPTGVMIEVPSALLILPELAKRVDFWSVGTNDLTQYLLAVDRNNTRVSELYTTYHPAVIRALDYVFQQGLQYHIPVSVCGEMAGEPLGCLILLALGYTHLSMSSFNLARMKYLIRRINIAEIKQLRPALLASESPEQTQALLTDYLTERELTNLIRMNPQDA